MSNTKATTTKDIRVSFSFRNHRKRKKLRLLIGDNSTDYLIDLWIATAMNHPDGVLTGMDEIDIALEAGWEKDPQIFVGALIKTGFLDRREDGTYALHDWEDHQGYVVHANARSEKGKKAANARWDAQNAQSNAPSIENHAQSNAQTAFSDAPSPVPFPSPAPAPSPFSFPPTPPSAEPDANEEKEKKGGEAVLVETNGHANGIPPDWQPKADTLSIFPSQGIPVEFAQQRISEFVLWHQEQQTVKAGFESLFVGWVKKAWLTAQTQAAQQPPPGARRKGQTLTERSMEIYHATQAAIAAVGGDTSDPFAAMWDRTTTSPEQRQITAGTDHVH